jgi:hypothetical protein
MNIPGFFLDGTDLDEHVTIVFFDRNGQRFLEEQIDLQPHRRRTLDVGSLIGENHGEIGTFSIFHSSTPAAITDLGSFLTERGYVSYRYQDAPLRAYVHGNLDAVSPGPGDHIERLGTSGLRQREYRLQHDIQGTALYEFGVVNSSSTSAWCTCQLASALNGEVQGLHRVKLSPGGVHLFSFPIDASVSLKAVIKSRLVMARPLVFRIQNSKLDVFHG